MDHIERGTLVLDAIDYLVLDEADEMLNMGFIGQVEAIINKLTKTADDYAIFSNASGKW